MNSKSHIKLRNIVIIMLVTAIISGFTSGLIVYSSYGKNTGISYKSINDDTNLKEFLEVYSQITSQYYEEVNKSDLIKSAISGMLDYLGDSYTTYMDLNQTNMLNESLKGEYDGIGILIQDHKVVEVFDDSPAYAAGVLPDDEIIKVNNESVADKSATEIANAIKFSKQKEISLSVLREGKQIDLTMQLSRLYVPAIASEVIENTSIGYLRLESFSSTVSKQVENSLKKLQQNNITSLIVDLRSNSGGFLSAAEDVSNIFIEKGKVIYSLKSKDSSKTVKDNTTEKALEIESRN